MPRIAIIGSGFSGLSAACFLARERFDVTVFEKNDTPGGRARKFHTDGFTFDMGPSWYWMPDVIENFFRQFDKTAAQYYNLVRIDPSYRIVYSASDVLDIPAGVLNLCHLFDSIEPGSGKQLEKYLHEGKFKYEIGMHDLVYKPGLSIAELLDFKIIKGAFKLHIFESISTYIRRYFKASKLIQLLEFPVLFLGAKPEKTPALYSLMNYADMSLGTWYPMGGMYEVVEAMVSLASSMNVKFAFNSNIQHLHVTANRVSSLAVNGRSLPFDYVVAAADYHHVEQELLPPAYRQYTETYWDQRVMAPSSLIFYLGINKVVKNLLHHTLFFDEDFRKHAEEIYDNPAWPTAPQFYVSCPSKTDPAVAPVGSEVLFILIPIGTGLKDSPQIRDKYFDMVMNRLERLLGEDIRAHVVYKKSYAHNDFMGDYNAFKGNAYGLANTLTQTANFKPSIINKKVSNLFYTGQLTVPGPGVPPSIISGQVVAKELIKNIRNS